MTSPLIIILISIIAGLFLIIGLQHKMLRQKDNHFRLRLQQVALPYFKSQMNPHFIKNLLQTINFFILFDSKENASKYLKKFSILVDKTLKQSDQELITLADEIEILEIYIELQSLRFPDKFDFSPISSGAVRHKPTIFLSREINPLETKIPPMVIQPFVENAIVHGLEPKSSKGFISVSFSKENNLLNCMISDNGIGRKASQDMQKNSDTSNGIGLKNVFRRLALLEETLKISINLEVSDLNPDDTDTGTVVLIGLPAKFPKTNGNSAGLDNLIEIQSKYMTKFLR